MPFFVSFDLEQENDFLGTDVIESYATYILDAKYEQANLHDVAFEQQDLLQCNLFDVLSKHKTNLMASLESICIKHSYWTQTWSKAGSSLCSLSPRCITKNSN